MTAPQILIQKAYITVNKPLDVAGIVGTIEPLTITNLGDQVSRLLYPDPSRFTSEPGSGIVYDPVTGLMWSQKETGELEWDAAEEACRACRLGGFSDWYLPNRFELHTIIDPERHAPCLPPIFETAGSYSWTSTQTAWTKGNAGSSRSFFSVLMDYGFVGSYGASNRLRARPVRRAAPASQ